MLAQRYFGYQNMFHSIKCYAKYCKIQKEFHFKNRDFDPPFNPHLKLIYRHKNLVIDENLFIYLHKVRWKFEICSISEKK